MKKVLVAVDDTKASKAVLSTFYNFVRQPEEVILLHVERLEGRSLMTGMLGDAEMSTLKDMIRDTEYKEELDRKAAKILAFYEERFRENGVGAVSSSVRVGHPAEEILKSASEEEVDLILLGFSGRKGLNRLIGGSVSKEVQKKSPVPVLTAKRPLICDEHYSWKDAYAAVSITTAIILGLFLLGTFLQRGDFIY
jgi:nucleotide-binding universal stress UspA family protein